ncbi:MAG TPA: hypothetical protein VJV05_00560 [Pyrinomonadaceae bacterium]|nr:hypothetical protein [Pyrinomonadaceae bacterium]
MKKHRMAVFALMVLLGVLSSSCVNYRTLADLDLGNGRRVKIATDWADTTLPIMAELFIDNHSRGQHVIAYEGEAEWGVLNKYRYEVWSEETEQLFVITQTNGEEERMPVIALDFNNEFGFPVCPADKCLDCSDGYCPSNHRACFAKFNQVIDVVEADNPGLELKRIEFDDAPPTNCN